MTPRRLLIPPILAYLAYCSSLTLLSHEGFPEGMRSGLGFPYLADKPVGEDGFYMLTVAWNMASGHGIVYNYDLPTSGIQPLSTGIFALLAWAVQSLGGDKWLFVRSVLAFGSVTLLLLGHIVGTIVRRLTDPDAKGLGYALGFLTVVFNFALFRLFTYGLETGIYLILLSSCILYTLALARKGEMRARQAVILGALGGVTAWARIDFCVVFLVFLGVSAIRRQFTVPWVVEVGSVTALFISPWLLYVYGVTGSWLPSSGSAQASLISMETAPSRLWAMGKAILSHLTPWVYSNAGNVFLAAAFLSLAIFVAFLCADRTLWPSLSLRLKQQSHLATWFVALAVLVLVYVLFFWASHFYQRYSAPLLVPLAVVMAAAVADRIRSSSRAVQIVLAYTLPMCFFLWAFLSLHTGRIGNTHVVTAGFVQRWFGSNKVGAFQSGVVGFFNSNVVNLDGKMNQRALKSAKAGRLHLYVDEEHIDVLVDWPGVIHGSLDREWLASNWGRCAEEIGNGASICLQRMSRSAK